jgi:hypothetical protein
LSTATPEPPGGILARGEEAAERGTRPEHRQQVRGDAHRADAFRLALAGQVVVAADRDRDLVEPVMPGLDVEILGGREPVFGDAQAGDRLQRIASRSASWYGSGRRSARSPR